MEKIHKSKVEVLVLIALVIFFFFSCSKRRDLENEMGSKKLVGHWYKALVDSNYREIFFTDTASLSYDVLVGLIYINIKEENDSIAFYQDGYLLSRYKLEFLSKDTALLTGSYGSPLQIIKVPNSKYSVLQIRNLFAGDDEEIEKFRLEFDDREYERRKQ